MYIDAESILGILGDTNEIGMYFLMCRVEPRILLPRLKENNVLVVCILDISVVIGSEFDFSTEWESKWISVQWEICSCARYILLIHCSSAYISNIYVL